MYTFFLLITFLSMFNTCFPVLDRDLGMPHIVADKNCSTVRLNIDFIR